MKYKIIKHRKYPNGVYFTAKHSRWGLFWLTVEKEAETYANYDSWKGPMRYTTENQAIEAIVEDKNRRKFSKQQRKREVIWRGTRRIA